MYIIILNYIKKKKCINIINFFYFYFFSIDHHFTIYFILYGLITTK